MKAMLLKRQCEIKTDSSYVPKTELPICEEPLDLEDVPDPTPGPHQIKIEISACGVCHTELDEIEGRLKIPKYPVIPGHEVVGRVVEKGRGADRLEIGQRVGVAWIYESCRNCRFCKGGFENLCNHFKGTGLDADGGYAEYMVVDEDFAYPIPDGFSDTEAAPLLCAGVIGYRALRLTGIKGGEILGLYGFGASAHITIQVAVHWGCKVFVFTREGQREHQELAKSLGAAWVGVTGESPPERLHAAIDFTPVGEPVKEALKVLEKGGRVVVNAIRKVNYIPELEYSQYLWYEKELKSVANVTRRDAEEFLPLAEEIGIRPEVRLFPLESANEALRILKMGKMQGAGVLKIG